MSSITRKVLTALVASAVTAAAASAQPVNYTTTGAFSGACAGTTCVGPNGYSLAFLGASTTLPGLNTPTFSSLGTFVLTAGAGTVSVPSGVVFFTLTINQTTPTAGADASTGSISGTVSATTDGFQSTLVWSPEQFLNIDPIQYQILFDTPFEAPTGLSIALNGPLTETTINARITTQAVPEPATVVLMGSGLAALGFFGARRKKA